MLYDTLHYMIALNLKLFFVLIAFGFIIGQTRQIAVRNISDKKLGNFLLDIFNLDESKLLCAVHHGELTDIVVVVHLALIDFLRARYIYIEGL